MRKGGRDREEKMEKEMESIAHYERAPLAL
jgi:hypothetical protein